MPDPDLLVMHKLLIDLTRIHDVSRKLLKMLFCKTGNVCSGFVMHCVNFSVYTIYPV